jgi:hypothetical protein
MHWPTPDIIMREPVFNLTEDFARRAVVSQSNDLILPQSDGTLSLYTYDDLTPTISASRRVWTVDALVLGSLAISPGAAYIAAVVANNTAGWHQYQQYSLLVLDARNGSLAWTLDLSEDGTPRIAVDDVRLVLLYTGRYFAYDLATGKRLWEWSGSHSSETCGTWQIDPTLPPAILAYRGYEAGTFPSLEGNVVASHLTPHCHL